MDFIGGVELEEVFETDMNTKMTTGVEMPAIRMNKM